MIPDGYFHFHGEDGIDLSYEGINQHFLSWAALLFNDNEINAHVQKSAKLKAFQTLPEPTGHFYSPSHFNTGTALGQANDQWSSYQRDHAMAMLVDDAKYLIWTGRSRSEWYRIGVPTPEEMKDDIAQSLIKRNDAFSQDDWAWTLTSDRAPAAWYPEHWMNGLAIAAIAYPEGFYDEVLAMQEGQDVRMQLPINQSGHAVELLGDAFVFVRSDSYGAIIHKGNTVTEWANGIPGFGGGGLSAFWTAETGTVWLGRSRGTQNADADQWTGTYGWDTWATHAISGVNRWGQPFSSARNRPIEVSEHIEEGNNTTIVVSGAIGKHDYSRSAPDGAIQGEFDYERRFSIGENGLEITTTLTSNQADEVGEIWEMLPLFLADTDQGVADASLQFFVDDQWVTATHTLQANVSGIRTARFEQAVDIVFSSPQRVKLGPAVWTSGQVSSRIQNVMIDLLNTNDDYAVVPAQTSVSYIIRDADIPSKGDVSGDGIISAFDAASVLQHTTDYESLDATGLDAADVSGDGTVTAFDASLILQYIVGLIECLPAADFCSSSAVVNE